jgi:hypothetical protein
LSSVQAVERSFQQRLSLNRQLSENAYWRLPVDSVRPEFVPVGRGLPTSDHCGRHISFLVCDNVAGHEGVVVKGVDYTGMLAVTHEHVFCNRPSCCVCFIRGWSLRSARSLEGRLNVLVERGYGDPEHIMVSVPEKDRHLSEAEMRERCRVAMLERGVLGGVMLFHAFRINREKGVLEHSPHYHSVGFIRGGFDVCRDCLHVREDCNECPCFKGREVRAYAKDGYIVKVGDKRKTVFGTLFYQLNHSSIRVGLKRFHISTWFGIAGNRKLKGKRVKPIHVCPVCAVKEVRSVMKKQVYRGDERIARNIGDVDYMKVFAMSPFLPDGSPVFVDVGDVGRFG